MKTLIRNAAALTCTAMALLTATGAEANNIQVTNPTLTNGTGGDATIQFDLSWENSWRGGGVSNWDAAWVFVKYYSGNAWHHAYLNNSGHVAASGSQIDVGLLSPGTAYNSSSNPVMGAFVYRNADGTGNLSLPGTQLGWNYGAQGLVFNDISKIQVLAIEMVYVPQGAFAAGSGGTETNGFTLTTINTGDATIAPVGTGSLGGQAGGYPTGQSAPASSSWPNGFNAFYCMKYEVSQQGYVDFLNTLSYVQQAARTGVAPNIGTNTELLSSSNRNGIVISTMGVPNTIPAVYACDLNHNYIYGEDIDGRDIACIRLKWDDLTAYLDWSGLRPMTELEFEKACRGNQPPVANEYPWGSTGIAVTSTYTLENDGSSSEGIASGYSTSMGNAAIGVSGPDPGPVRVGIFAANSSNTGRITAGAGYYGIMDLAGNVCERTVAILENGNQAYTGVHGDGSLTVIGDPDVSNWPGVSSGGTGFGQRGDGWADPVANGYARVSDRSGAIDDFDARSFQNGGRGVRTAP